MNLQCPACGKKTRLSDENVVKFAGRKVKCPGCAEPISVPGNPPAAPKKAQPLDAAPAPAKPPAAAAPPVAAAPAAAKPPAAAAPTSAAAPADPFAGLGAQTGSGGSGIGIATDDTRSPASRVKKSKGSNMPLILAGVGGVAAVGIVAVVGIIMLGGGGGGGGTVPTDNPTAVIDPAIQETVSVGGKGQLTLVWPESERSGANVQVDGKDMELPASGPISYLVSTGQHRVVIRRRGFEQIETQVVVPEKDSITFSPSFKPVIAPGIEQFASDVNHLAGGTDANASFDDWLQDFEKAKGDAAVNHKDVLILFNESDTNPQCMQMARKVIFDTRFGPRVASEYALVHIDFPKGAAAKGKVQNAARNESLRKEFGIESFPTAVLTDSKGYPYAKLEYEAGDIFDFSEEVENAQQVRQNRDDLARFVEEGDWERRKAAAQQFMAIMSQQNLEWFYSKKYQKWYDDVQKADPNNQMGHNELFFQLIWMCRVFENRRMKNDAGIRSAVKQIDAWEDDNDFRDGNRAALLYLLAADTMARLKDKEAVRRYAEKGMAYRTDNESLAAGLKYYANADSFNVLGNGTGFVVAPGYVMTNHHVIEGDTDIAVRLPGIDDPAPATVIAQNEKNDLALLKVDHPAMANIEPVALSLTPPGRGMNIGVFGYPLSDSLGNELKLTAGIIGATGSSRDDGMLLLNATVNPGNSGGPLCNTAGEVIGIVTAKSIQRSASEDTYGMAVPADRVVAFLKQHLPDYQPPPEPTEEFPDMPPPNWARVDRQISGSVLQVLQLQN